jgi:hypothetical protein
MALSLIPVLEFEPAVYADPARPSPRWTPDETPQDWAAYWRAALNDAGIDELTPLRAGGWRVPITHVTRPSTLRTLITTIMNRADPQGAAQVPVLPGGYALVGGDATIEPGCCSDFSTLHDWRDAARWQRPALKMVWIGHPWTYVSADGDVLHLLPPAEAEPPPTTRPLLTVGRQELLAAVAQAAQEVERFAARLCAICDAPTLPLTKEQLVQILIWGHAAAHG